MSFPLITVAGGNEELGYGTYGSYGIRISPCYKYVSVKLGCVLATCFAAACVLPLLTDS